jgi:hypothetical protein
MRFHEFLKSVYVTRKIACDKAPTPWKHASVGAIARLDWGYTFALCMVAIVFLVVRFALTKAGILSAPRKAEDLLAELQAQGEAMAQAAKPVSEQIKGSMLEKFDKTAKQRKAELN